MKKQNVMDMTWHCGCRTYENGINMVWDKCPLHKAAQQLLEAAKFALDAWGKLPGSAQIGTNPKVGDFLVYAISKAEGKSISPAGATSPATQTGGANLKGGK